MISRSQRAFCLRPSLGECSGGQVCRKGKNKSKSPPDNLLDAIEKLVRQLFALAGIKGAQFVQVVNTAIF